MKLTPGMIFLIKKNVTLFTPNGTLTLYKNDVFLLLAINIASNPVLVITSSGLKKYFKSLFVLDVNYKRIEKVS